MAQYPSDRTKTAFTSVYRFLDGGEQRFRTGTGPLKRWVIRLDYLDESELVALEDFFLSQSGKYGSFSFTDPWDSTVHPNCSMDADTLELNFSDVGRGQSHLVVKENR